MHGRRRSRAVLVALGVLLLAAGPAAAEPDAAAAAAAAAGLRARVLRAIERMLTATPAANMLRHGGYVVEYADASDDVDVVIDVRFLEVMLEGAPPQVSAELFGYYVAGAVKFDLTHPDQRSEPLADVVPAFEAVLYRYRQLREHAGLHSPFLDRLAERHARGGLDEFVKAAPAAPDPEPRPEGRGTRKGTGR